MSEVQKYTDQQRASLGFLVSDRLIEVIGAGNTLLDLASVLISEQVSFGKDNIVYPNVVIERKGSGSVCIGDGNIFYPGTHIIGSAGEIRIGNRNEFGPAGVTIKANMPDARITIGNDGRYCDGASIMGETILGSGSQVLGSIAVQSCSLAEGGKFQEPDPDARAAVLKGFGLARNITLSIGQVVNGAGDFSQFPIEQQSAYHPKPKAD